jgi:tryptophan synthase alpha chain
MTSPTMTSPPGPSRIDSIFADLRGAGRTAIMPFVTAGFPSLDVTEAVLPALDDAGASVIELGIPFSDPIADGPIIAASMHEAILSGTTPAGVLEMVRRVRDRVDAGLVAMVSDSIVHRLGSERFVDAAAEAGFDGLIVPDLDLAAARSLSARAGERGLSFSLLVAPTTSAARLERITDLCRGFVYLLARAGITGERNERPDVEARVAEVRAVTDLPIAVGFGISSAEHVAAVTGCADAAIVGSALVRAMAEATNPTAAAVEMVSSLASGLQSRPGGVPSV